MTWWVVAAWLFGFWVGYKQAVKDIREKIKHELEKKA